MVETEVDESRTSVAIDTFRLGHTNASNQLAARDGGTNRSVRHGIGFYSWAVQGNRLSPRRDHVRGNGIAGVSS